MWAHYLTIWTGNLYSACGLITILWGFASEMPYPTAPDYAEFSPLDDGSMGQWFVYRGYRHWNGFDLFIGVWAMVTGQVLVMLEHYVWIYRLTGEYYDRSFALVMVALPGMVATPTMVSGLMLLLPAMANVLASLAGETFNPPPKQAPRKSTAPKEKWSVRAWNWLGGHDYTVQKPRIIFACAYFVFNLFIGTLFFLQNVEANNSKYEFLKSEGYTETDPHWIIAERGLPGCEAIGLCGIMTTWVPAAKFFGGIMDINFSVILIPVAHKFMSLVYGLTTSNQGGVSKIVQKILWWIPIDQSLLFHKVCGCVGAWAAVCHTVCHLFNFVQRPELVWRVFNWYIWFTGVGLLVIIFLAGTSILAEVKRNHFYIFYYNHMMYPFFFALTLWHSYQFGNYIWFFIPPGSIYLCERVYRWHESRIPATLAHVTFMNNGVMSLALCKKGPWAHPYKCGQYAHIGCPYVSRFEWHPFTISSAPEEQYVTWHIRVQGPGSWTRRVAEFMKMMGKKGEPRIDFHREQSEIAPAKDGAAEVYGIPLLLFHGPSSAPTEHLSEYEEVIMGASGIGVTPVVASMKSIVMHKWSHSAGKTYPANATFVWVCSYKDIKMFRWFIRTITECDAYYNQCVANGTIVAEEHHFAVHLFVTSFKKMDQLDAPASDSDHDDVAFWGRECAEKSIDMETHADRKSVV